MQRARGVERRVQELLAEEEHDDEHDRSEHGDLDDVLGRDPEHVAQQVAEEVADVVVDRAEERDPQREHAGEQDADCGVEAEAALARDPADGEGRRDGCHGPADVERDTQQERDDEPGNAAWLTASPMNARPRRTTNAPTTAHTIPTRTAATRPRCMKPSCIGRPGTRPGSSAPFVEVPGWRVVVMMGIVDDRRLTLRQYDDVAAVGLA